MHEQHDRGLWIERLTTARFDGRPALFLDRDGVVVEEVHFLERAEDIRLTEGVAEAIAAANRAGVAVVIVTNQSGIARGLYGWAEFAAVQAELVRQLLERGAAVDLVLACGYHIDGEGELARDHDWRKPKPGMLHAAASLLGVSLPRSLIIGDRLSDIEAGRAAGLVRAALVETGYGAGEWAALTSRSDAQASGFELQRAPSAAQAIAAWLADLR